MHTLERELRAALVMGVDGDGPRSSTGMAVAARPTRGFHTTKSRDIFSLLLALIYRSFTRK